MLKKVAGTLHWHLTFWLHNVNEKDGLARPKVTYELRDDIKIWTGFDVFYGKRDGLFGQFDENDRVVSGIEWGI